jgi:hypothetical protein
MAGYTRTDTTNNIADGNIINATDLDNEFDGIQAAFNSSTGHNHDGTTGEGAPILALGPTQDVVVGAATVTPKTTNTVDIGSASLKFKDLHMAGNALIGGTLGVTGVATFTAQPVLSSLTASRAVFSDASKGLVSNAITGTGNVVMSASPTLTGTIGGENATLSGTLAVTGVATFTAQPIVSSLTASRAVFSDASKGLVSNAITGTGNVVMSASPTLTGTISAEALTASGAVTLSGGTANGVAFLNGSKVLTTGSALTFDGTNLGIGGAANNYGANITYQSIYGSTAAGLDFYNGATRNGFVSATSTDVNFGALTNIPVRFIQNNAEQMRLTSTGLGIGTSSPGAKLQVAGSGRFTGFDTGFYNENVLAIGNASFNPKLGLASVSGYRWNAQIKDVGGTGEYVIRYEEGSLDALTITRAGNLGLGVTPSAWGSTYKAIQIGTGGSVNGRTNTENQVGLSANAFHNGTSWTYIASTTATQYQQAAGIHYWFNAPSGTAGNAITFTQAMSLTAAGELLVGTTSGIGANKVVIKGDISLGLQGSTGTSCGDINFYNSSATKYWSISTNQTNFYIADDNFSNYAYLTQNPTAWQFGSDSRIKTDITELDYGLATVMAIQPKRYKLKTSGKIDIGFIAQELRDVVPEAVSGQGGEFLDTDTPQERAAKTLGVGKETLIPILVKAIQELKAEFDAYKATHP